MKRNKFLLAAASACAVWFAAAGAACAEEDPFAYEDSVELDDSWGDDGLFAEVFDQDDLSQEQTERHTEDGASFIEDSRVVSFKEEGLSWDDLLAAQEEARKAMEDAKRAGLISGDMPILRAADPAKLEKYLDLLYTEPNPTGSNGELKIASVIEKVMKEYGYDVQEQSFHEGFLNEQLVDVPGVNIFVERGANSMYRSSRILLVTAHYDSKTPEIEQLQQGQNKEDYSGQNVEDTKDQAGQKWKNWDLDNDKTGAAMLLETAAILSNLQSDLDVCFVFLSGEEDGYYGSLRFIENLSEDLRSRICGVICLGTVGLADEPVLLGTPNGKANDPSLILRACAMEIEAEKLIDGIVVDEIPGITTDDWKLVKECSELQEEVTADAAGGEASSANEGGNEGQITGRTNESGEAEPFSGGDPDAIEVMTEDTVAIIGGRRICPSAVRFSQAGFDKVVSFGHEMPKTAHSKQDEDESIVIGAASEGPETDLIDHLIETGAAGSQPGGIIKENRMIDIDRMAHTTDILAAAIGRYMMSLT